MTVQRVCAICKQIYFIDNGDNIPLCHTCYTELLDEKKTLKQKIKYLQSIKGIK